MNRRNFLKGLLTAGVVTLVQPTLPVSMTAPAPVVSFEEIARITLAKYRHIISDSILSCSRDSPYWVLKDHREKVGTKCLVEPLIYE